MDEEILGVIDLDEYSVDALVWYASSVLEGVIEDPGAAVEGGAVTKFAEAFLGLPTGPLKTPTTQRRLQELCAELKKRRSPNPEKTGMSCVAGLYDVL